jgi:protein-tyrosine phosphatase
VQSIERADGESPPPLPRSADVTGTPTFNLLFVCTGNICRSAFAEVLCRQLLEDRLGPEARRVFACSSGGLRAVTGARMHPETRDVLALWGRPLYRAAGDFVARPLRPHMVRWADLILTAEDAQRGDIAWNAPDASRRLFTMRRFGRIVRELDPTRLPADPLERARAVVAAAAESREPVRADQDTIPDPVGLPPSEHLVAADLIFDVVGSFIDLVAPAPS